VKSTKLVLIALASAIIYEQKVDESVIALDRLLIAPSSRGLESKISARLRLSVS
jgi:hypothetical protein